jgi:hypothetical protein
MMTLVDILLMQQTLVQGASIFFCFLGADSDVVRNLFFILKILL